MRPLVFAFVWIAALHAQTAPDTVIRVETREVVVDVTVSGKGSKPGTLTARDFAISEDGKAQKINSVSSANTDPDTAQKHFVLYFDYTTMSLRDQAASRQAATEFVDTMATPDRYMAVVAMNSSGSRVVQGFTNSRTLLQKAVTVPISGGTVNNNVVQNLYDSLTAVAASLAPAPGRKTVLYFTGGHPLALDDPRTAKVISALNRANIAVYVISSNRNTDDAAAPGQMMGARSPVRGGRAGINVATRDASADFATTLTEQTGGELLTFSAKLTDRLGTVAREQDGYYRVAYTPPPAKEGSCHALKVAVNVKNLEAKARDEYCTERPVDVVAGKIAGQALEARAAGKSAGSLHASVQLPWVYTGANRANVRLTAEAIPAGMKFEKLYGEIDVVGTLLRPDGGTAARFADTVDIDPEDQARADAFTRAPWRYEHPFAVAAGTYVLRLAIGAGPSATGAVEMPLTVEPWNPATFGIAGLAFGTELRAVDANAEAPVLESHAPLVVGGRQFVVAASDKFASSGHLYFYTEIYEPTLAGGGSPATLKAQVRVLDRKSGAVKIDTGTGGIGEYVHPGSATVPFATTIPVAKLAPGSYRLEVSAMHSTGAEVVKREADFEVLP